MTSVIKIHVLFDNRLCLPLSLVLEVLWCGSVLVSSGFAAKTESDAFLTCFFTQELQRDRISNIELSGTLNKIQDQKAHLEVYLN